MPRSICDRIPPALVVGGILIGFPAEMLALLAGLRHHSLVQVITRISFCPKNMRTSTIADEIAGRWRGQFLVLLLLSGAIVSRPEPAMAVLVKFQVDMSVQEAIGRFDAQTDIVELRGSFNVWEGGDEMERGEGDSSLYSLEIDVPDEPGATIPYKFVIIADGGRVVWESDVGDGQTNRTMLLEGDGQELPAVFFDNLSVDPGAGIEVTFLVDMKARIDEASFDPASDLVEVRGPFNDWEGGSELAPVEEGSSVYGGAVTVAFILPGTQVAYKYIINGGEWETGENRYFELGEQAHSVPVRYFDDIEPVDLGPLGSIAISPVVDGMVTVFWENANAVLQGTPDLASGPWDPIGVPEGETQATISTDLAGQLFFRVVLP